MHSVLWSITQHLIRQGLTAVFMLTLMWQITPLELGLVGIANIWNSFLSLFLELGFGAALVQRKELSPEHPSSVFALNIAAGVVLMLMSIAGSGIFANLMNAPQAQPIIAALSIGFLLTALASAQNSLAVRELRFKALAIRDLVATSVAAIVGIVLALHGYGIWAVVVHSLLQNLLRTLLIWRLTPHRLRLKDARWVAIKDLWGFGSRIFASSVLNHIVRNTDSIVIGAILGPEKLGIYNLTQRVTLAPIKGVTAGLGAFLFSKASRVQDDRDRLKDLYVVAFKALNYLLAMYGIALVTVGVGLMPLVFGSQWAEAATPMRLMAAALLVGAATVPLGEVMKATNHPGWLLRWGIFFSVITTTALAVGMKYGFYYAVASYSMSYFLALPVVFWIIQKTTGLSLREFAARTASSYLTLAAFGAAATSCWIALQDRPFVAAAAVALLGIIVVLFAARTDPDRVRFIGLIPKRFRGRFGPTLT